MRLLSVSTVLAVVATTLAPSEGFCPTATQSKSINRRIHLFKESDHVDDNNMNNSDINSRNIDRRELFGLAISAAMITSTLFHSFAVYAAESSGSVTKKALGEEYRQGTSALADMDSAAPVPREAYKKLSSGVVYADLRPGTGIEEVKLGSRVNIQWVLRKSNGYFVDSSAVNDSIPYIFTVGNGQAIKGLDEGILGMKLNGVRRILMPPSLAYVEGLEDDKPGPIPIGFGPKQQMRRVQTVRKDVPGEYVFLEIQLTRVR